MQHAQSGMFPFCFVFLFCFVLFSRIDFIVNFQLNSLALTMSTDGLVKMFTDCKRDYMSKSCDRIRFFVINLLLYQSYRRLGKREKPFRAPYLKPIWYKVTGSLSSRITSLWYLVNFKDKTFFLTTETLCDKIFFVHIAACLCYILLFIFGSY